MLGTRYQSLARLAVRWTSLGPPPSPPPKLGSFSHRYDVFLAKYPRLHSLHHRVVNGSRWCVMDVKSLWALRSIDVHDETELGKLTIPQLETLIESPSEAAKMLSLLVVLNIPGPGDLLIVLLIFFPKLVLTRHFWTEQQREEFFLSDVKKSVEWAKSLLDEKLPRTIEELSFQQKRELSMLYGGLGIVPWSVTKLKDRYNLTRNIDSRLEVSQLTRQQLVFHLFLRRVGYTIDEDANSLRKRLENAIRRAQSSSSPVEYLTTSLRSH